MNLSTDKKAEESIQVLKRFVTPDLLAEILEDCEYDPETELRTLVDIAKNSTSGALKMRAIAMIRKLVEDVLEEKEVTLSDDSPLTAFAPQITKGAKINDPSKSATNDPTHKPGRAGDLYSGLCRGQK